MRTYVPLPPFVFRRFPTPLLNNYSSHTVVAPNQIRNKERALSNGNSLSGGYTVRRGNIFSPQPGPHGFLCFKYANENTDPFARSGSFLPGRSYYSRSSRLWEIMTSGFSFCAAKYRRIIGIIHLCPHELPVCKTRRIGGVYASARRVEINVIGITRPRVYNRGIKTFEKQRKGTARRFGLTPVSVRAFFGGLHISRAAPSDFMKATFRGFCNHRVATL